MLHNNFLLRFVRVGLEIGSGLALNVGATYLTGGAATIPLGIMMVGVAASLLAAKGTTETHLTAPVQANAERELLRLVEKYGSLRAALETISSCGESIGGFSGEAARAILSLEDQPENGPELPDDGMLIYIGEWLARWCSENTAKLEDVRQAVEAHTELLRGAIAKIDEASSENQASHQVTQQFVRRVPYFVGFDQYIRPLLDHSRLFRHDWAVVGRDKEMNALSEFVQSGNECVGIVCGRGGIGKSKLLIAALQHARAAGMTNPVYFVPEHIPLRDITEAELPAAGSVVVIDDAHRYEDFAALLELLNTHSPGVRVLVATRPHAFDYLKSTITGAKYDATQLRVFPTLENLSKSDVKLLAEQALGPEYKYLSDHVVDSTWDSPLVTVIAGQLVAREALSPALLERKTEFRDSVLGRFRDEMVGAIDERVARADCVSLLKVLSAIAPTNTTDLQFIELAAKFTELSDDRVQRAAAAMESAGLLLRRGRTVRIVPDVLADYVLNHACVQNGVATGFAEKVFNEFFEAFPEQVLKNLAELDWRNQHGGGPDVNLLERIWATLEQDFKTSDFNRQVAILKVLKTVAYLQPQHVLPIVEFSIREAFSGPQERDNDPRCWTTRGADVLRQVPSVLREIAYRIDYLSHCCDLLWKLGRGDSRPLGPNPDHPIRILHDIASYGRHKLLRVHEIILDRGLAWWDEPDVDSHVHSPLAVLNALLGKAGLSSVSRGHAIHYSPFLVDAKVTRPFREKVIGRLKEAARGANAEVANAALKLLGNFLLPPHAPFGMPVSDADVTQWVPEQQDVLADMVDAFASTSDSVRRIQIAAALPVYLRLRKSLREREMIRPIIDALVNDPDVRRLRCVLQGGRIDIEDDDHDETNDWKAEAERRNAEISAVARQVISTYPELKDAHYRLHDDLRRMRLAGLEADNWSLFHAIANADAIYGMRLARLIWVDPESPLLGRSDVFLAHYRVVNPERAGTILGDLATSDKVPLRRLSAQYLNSSRCLIAPTPAELAVVDRLLVDGDEATLGGVIDALSDLQVADARGAIDRVLSVKVGSTPGLARKVCQVLMKDYQSLHEATTDADLTRMLEILRAVTSIDDYHVAQFLQEAAKRLPEAVVDFALARTCHDRGDLRYNALPQSAAMFDVGILAQAPNYKALLRRVRDAMFAGEFSSFWLPKLYAYMSGHFAEAASVTVLTENIETRNADQLKNIVHMLREAGPRFVFNHRELVSQMLERAFDLGDDCYQSVRYYLNVSAVHCSRSGTAGQPFPQDIDLRDRATELLKSCTPGSRLHEFYESIRKEAVANINQSLSEAEFDE